MLGITVELGNYSVKFLTYKIDRKETILLETDEVVTDYDSLDPNLEVEKLWANQLEITQNYLEKFDDEIQIMMTLPADIISTRYLAMPVKNKKTAMNMLPFQIEEDLPYPLSDCHWSETLTMHPQHAEAVVAVVKKVHFDSFFNLLKLNGLKPKILTSDVSSLAGLVKMNASYFPNSFCIIDIGHHATRSFYFHNGLLVANHNSYVAGASITESISKTYSISIEEATLYKHQNSFLLTQDQYDQVNDNQREFAKVMDATMQPLLHEIKRWDIGFRVSHGVKPDEMYICGGTSNIKNIKNYLAEKLNISIKNFNPYQFVNDEHFDNDEKFRNKFSGAVSFSANAPKKSQLINFLKDDYQLENNTDLPLNSMAFISTRLAILTTIAAIFFVVSGLLLNSDITKAKKILGAQLDVKKGFNKSTKLAKSFKRTQISERSIRDLDKLIKRKQKSMKAEISVIKNSQKTGAMNYFNLVTASLDGYDIEILKFIVDDTSQIDITIKGKDEPTLKSIQEAFESKTNLKWITEMKKDDLTLTMASQGKN